MDNIERVREILKSENIKYNEEELEKVVNFASNAYVDMKKGNIDIIAVHYNSGSESINLTQARYCIYYSLSHSYGLYRQSRKRVHRPGQNKPVVYYHLIAQIPKVITVDDKIIEAMKNKQDLLEYLLETEK